MSNVRIPSSDEDKKRIKGCIEEISNAMTMMDAQRTFIKEAVNSCVEDVEIDKKHLRKMATIYHKQNMEESRTEANEVYELYEELFQ